MPHPQKYRLFFHTPPAALEACKAAIFNAGAGRYPGGKYTECAWAVLGQAQFRPGQAAKPHLGVAGQLERTEEVRVEVVCFGEEVVREAVGALRRAHPYEEPSYGVESIESCSLGICLSRGERRLREGVQSRGGRAQSYAHNWSHPPEYEALSYAWGDAKDVEWITCQDRELKVTRSLYNALRHLRLQDKSRMLWADAICINQSDVPERSSQVTQMLRIYQTAKTVIVWLGPDSEKGQAKQAVNAIRTISDFICQRVGIPVSDLSSISDVYQEVIFKNKKSLPLPNDCDFVTGSMWQSLVWFYSHLYFTRVWAIQEVNATTERVVHCGHETVEWDRVALVAGYIIMETASSKSLGFSTAKCWFAAIMTTERIRQPKNWLFMLYLTSNFNSTDPRDQIYGLRGLMRLSGGDAPEGLLHPDYAKSDTEVYRDSVEAGLVHFQNTDVLLYRKGDESPSWIPRWDRPMLFRNPFRFGKALPWRPAGLTKPVWTIDKEANLLSLSGYTIDCIKDTVPYRESIFGNAMIESDEGREELGKLWQQILTTMERSFRQTPFDASILTAAATSFSFGLDENSDPTNERLLLHKFIAYLRLILSNETLNKYIPQNLSEETEYANGLLFGKPVWDFPYPESSFFLTATGMAGCCVSTTQAEDVVFAPLGSTYPFVLRRHGDCYSLRGFAFVYGMMRGERVGREVESVTIC
ncbi:HET-domain-containing protein [Pseudovirgaria hyperparasitica]|uniref:ATP phosphoribosyltransferase n=1 Tax=Pseudovirgaria hyperparasitica TaxID=470096 RepID=A0A6A6WBB8_9PEZI|nr:HET-domain-containing protein [Pseudovirgaria hyperparasitica]KAF2758401.1 HET-domain-containing protein [Pseudovirgaria hyperparasitica]